jgi:hypothetical protein
MTLDEIKALSIPAAENCVLWLCMGLHAKDNPYVGKASARPGQLAPESNGALYSRHQRPAGRHANESNNTPPCTR